MLPLIVVVLLVPTAAGFILAGPGAGVALGGLTLALLVFVVARSRPRDPIAEGPPEPGEAMLALAIEPITSRATADRLAELAARALPDSDRPKVVALAPVRPSARQRWLSIRGSTRPDAQREADRAVAELEAAGCEARGRIVDENPVLAIADTALLDGAAAVAFVVADDSHDEQIEEIRTRVERPVHKVSVHPPRSA
jgi:hypothetical protein